MPKSEVIEQEKWKLPKDVLLPAVLKSVEEKTIPYVNKQGKDDSFTKWVWEFEVIDGQYEGLRAWADTEPKITTENNVRHWGETLAQTTFDLGDGFDTDDLLGLTCCITVDNTEYKKKDGTISYMCPIQDVFPASAIGDDEPPF